MRIFLFVVIYDNSLAARRGLHSCAAAVCRNIAKMCEKFSTIVLLFTSYRQVAVVFIIIIIIIIISSLLKKAVANGLTCCPRHVACSKFTQGSMLICKLSLSDVSPSQGTFFIVPSDVSTGLLTVYGFAPPLLFGTESKLGWGFSLGPHADFQILYEFGPTVDSRPLHSRVSDNVLFVFPPGVRASRRNRHARRPLIHLLIKAGLLDSPNQPRTIEDDDEPR
ncbi:hypothetical protein EVAR_78915_1 [Eumeta japonica]|uniref:Uncharacterized protein n=1 Tax=Eumeta variegata TaxID=151549 RepID=A0A4C1U3Y4_EUMVA|nr:hypothetical protein EVAR_78915_1 [Eumeta japonica]